MTPPPLPIAVRPLLSAGLSLAVWAGLGGCDFGGPAVVADANGPAAAQPANLPAPAAVPAAPRAEPRRSAPRSAPRRSPARSEPRTPSPRRGELDPSTDPAAPVPFREDGGLTTEPGAGPDPFDPEIDPATLAPPTPVASADSGPTAELKDYPLTAAVPPDREPLPEDLAPPAGTLLSHQDGRDWAEVELKADDDTVPGDEAALRVHRTDRPAAFPDVRVPRAQLLIAKRTVRSLRLAQQRAEASGEPVPYRRGAGGEDASDPPATAEGAGDGEPGGANDPFAGGEGFTETEPITAGEPPAEPAARLLDDYPIDAELPPGTRVVPPDLKVPDGTRLAVCWGSRWHEVKAVEAEPGGPILVDWKEFGAGFTGWVAREQLIVRDVDAFRLPRQPIPARP